MDPKSPAHPQRDPSAIGQIFNSSGPGPFQGTVDARFNEISRAMAMIHFRSSSVSAFGNRMSAIDCNMDGIADLIPDGLPKLNAAINAGLCGPGGLPEGAMDSTGEFAGGGDSSTGSGTDLGGEAGGAADLPQVPFPTEGLGALTGAANFASAMESAFNIDMTSPGAGEQLNALTDSIGSSGLADAISNMPFDHMPTLGALQDTTNAMNNTAGNLGLELLGPNAGEQLHAVMKGDFSDFGTAPQMDLSGGTSQIDPPGTSSMKRAGGGEEGGAGFTSMELSALATTELTVQNAFGIDMMSEGGVTALSDAMGAMSDNLAGAPDMAEALPMADMAPAMGMLGALSGIKHDLGANLLNKGTGDILGSALSSMQDNGVADLLASATPEMFNNVTAAVASNVDAAGEGKGLAGGGGSQAQGGGGADAEASEAMKATADIQTAFGLGISAASDVTASEALSVGMNQMASEGLGDLLGNVPAPDPGMLMGAMFSNLAKSVTGVSLTAAGPSGAE